MAKDITPPNSFIQPPLTPPPTDKVTPSSVSQIINIFDKHRRGFRQDPWTEYTLRPDEYHEFQGYDYEPLESRLAIRMPTPLHETFCAKVVSEDYIAA
ncbi:uncharacterized protein BDV14DRAFT_180619 [Aspergillus stella-maris]|uniref:uncharacterized protein n=1 Tax=Aspergillus stella-maris TaxID=1810926 RepID=UPI003CCDE72C